MAPPQAPKSMQAPKSTIPQDLLAQFQCPFDAPSVPCQRLATTPTGTGSCPFVGHRSQVVVTPNPTHPLRQIPSEICLSHLLGECVRNEVSKSGNGDLVSGCSDGAHPCGEDLNELEDYIHKVRRAVGTPKKVSGLATPEVATPKATTSKVATPSVTPVATPSATQVATPKVETPKATTSKVATPLVTPVATPSATQVATPKVETPKATTSKVATPLVTPVATPSPTPQATPTGSPAHPEVPSPQVTVVATTSKTQRSSSRPSEGSESESYSYSYSYDHPQPVNPCMDCIFLWACIVMILLIVILILANKYARPVILLFR